MSRPYIQSDNGNDAIFWGGTKGPNAGWQLELDKAKRYISVKVAKRALAAIIKFDPTATGEVIVPTPRYRVTANPSALGKSLRPFIGRIGIYVSEGATEIRLDFGDQGCRNFKKHLLTRAITPAQKY